MLHNVLCFINSLAIFFYSVFSILDFIVYITNMHLFIFVIIIVYFIVDKIMIINFSTN